MNKKRYRILLMILATAMLCAPACFAGAPAEGYDISDNMYVKAETTYYWEGRYSDGRVFPEYLAKELAGNFDKVVNYAVGGAFSGVLTGSVEDGTDRSNWSTWLRGWGGVEQTETFVKEKAGKADPGALYVISVGYNDSYTLGVLGTAGAAQKSAENIVEMLGNLADAGATDFLVMLLHTNPGKDESEFTKTHRETTQKAVNGFIAENGGLSVTMVCLDELYRDMEKQGTTAYGYKTWGFYMISDWVPAYGYALAAEDNSKILPTSAAEDIYGYGYYYSTDSGYYTPEAASYAVDEFFGYDEYHATSKTHKHIAAYLLNADIATDSGTFKNVYNGKPSPFAESPMAKKTYTMVYSFGDSMIDSGKALEVTGKLVRDRAVKSVGIGDMRDCGKKEWYSTYVNYVLQCGIMKGTGAGTFAPDNPITCAQFITLLGRAAGVEDSAGNNYYASHVSWAAEKGIAGDFVPGERLSRGDAAKMIGVYAGVIGKELPEPGEDFINENLLFPGETVTRAQAASILAKLLNL